MAELEPLAHLHAYWLGAEPPFRRRSGHVGLRQQGRVFALSQAGVASISVHQSEVEDAWLEPASAWLIVSHLGLPSWFGYVDTVREDADSIQIMLKDPIAAVLADTRSPKALELEGSAGNAIRRMMAEVEAYQSTEIALGVIAEGTEVIEKLSATDIASALSSLLEAAPTYDYWLTVAGETLPEVRLNWGEPGNDRSSSLLTEGHEIVEKPTLIRRRSGLVRSVLYTSAAERFEDSEGAEITIGDDPGIGDWPSQPTHDPWVGPLPPSPSPAGRKQWVKITLDDMKWGQLAQRGEGVLRRELELGLELELTLDLGSEAVRDLWLGDTVRVWCPSLRAGAGFRGTVRIRGLEPHEETGRLDAIVGVVSEGQA